MRLTKIYSKIYTILTQKPCIRILKKNGLTVGKNLSVQNGSIIDISHCWLISIGDNVTLGPNAHILAHDASTKRFIGYTKIGRVNIGNNVFIGAGSIILPNVTIGDNVVIGAGSIICKDVPSNCVVAGNPAKVIGTIDNYLSKFNKIEDDLRFGEEYTLRKKIDNTKKEEMKVNLKDKLGLVK